MKVTRHVESRKKVKNKKKNRAYNPYYIGETDEGGDEGLCPCRCICNPAVTVCCCLCSRLIKLDCLLCCRFTNYCLYRLKLIMCIILAIPKIILDFIKHIVCCLGFILTILALVALLIFLLRTFCSQIMSFIDFIFFSGGSMIFPFRSYYYSMISNLYNQYTSSTGQPYSDLIFTWNESVPNISTFLADSLDMIAQVHKRLFSDKLDQQSIEFLTISLAQRMDYLYQTVTGILKIFLETDVSELSNLSSISRNITTTFIQNQAPISQCFSDYPQLGLQCLLIGSILSVSPQQSFHSNGPIGIPFQFSPQGLFNTPMYNLPYDIDPYPGINYNPIYDVNHMKTIFTGTPGVLNRNLLFFNENNPIKSYKYDPIKSSRIHNGGDDDFNRIKTKIDGLIYIISFVCNNLDTDDCILCNSIKPILDNIAGTSEDEVKNNIVVVLSEFIFRILPREILSRFNEPRHLLYSKEFQLVFHKLINLHDPNRKHKNNINSATDFNGHVKRDNPRTTGYNDDDDDDDGTKTTFSSSSSSNNNGCSKDIGDSFVLVNDHRMSMDYFTWLKMNSKEFNDYATDSDKVESDFSPNITDDAGIMDVIIQKITLVTTNGNSRVRDRKLLVVLYPPIVSCFNTLPPDPLCIIQGFLPLPITTTGVLNTIVTALANFDCDCTDLGYSEDPFWTVLPVFNNTWLILKTIISGIFTIPVFSSIISSVTLPTWIEDTFFISPPGTPLTADEILCAIIHLDSAIILLMTVLVLMALLGSILKAICKIIQCCAQLRMLRELLILSRQFIITPKYIDIIENRVRRLVEKDIVRKRHTRRFSLEIRTLAKIDTASSIVEGELPIINDDDYGDITSQMMSENNDNRSDIQDSTIINTDIKKRTKNSEEQYKQLISNSKSIDLDIETGNLNDLPKSEIVNDLISSQIRPVSSDSKQSLYENHVMGRNTHNITKKSNTKVENYEKLIKSKIHTVKQLYVIKNHAKSQGIHLTEQELLQWYATYSTMHKCYVYGNSRSVLKMIPAILQYGKNATKSSNSNWIKFGSTIQFNSLARAELYPKSCAKVFTLCTYYGTRESIRIMTETSLHDLEENLDIIV